MAHDSVGLIVFWGAVLSSLFTVLVLSILFTQGPEGIRAQDGSLRKSRSAGQALRAIAVLLAFLGPLVLAVADFARQNQTEHVWWTELAVAYAVFQVFNVYDLIVLDYVLLRLVLPKWVRFPQTAYFTTLRPHFLSFLKGSVAGIPLSGIAVAISRALR